MMNTKRDHESVDHTSNDNEEEKEEGEKEMMATNFTLIDLYQCSKMGDTDSLLEWMNKKALKDQLTHLIRTPFPSSINSYGDTSIHVASRYGHIEILKLLIKCDKEIDSGLFSLENEVKEDPKDIAYNTEIYHFLEELTSRFDTISSINQETLKTPMHYLIIKNEELLLDWVEKNRKDMSLVKEFATFTDCHGYSICHYCALFNFDHLLGTLLKILKDLNISYYKLTTNNGSTILHEAVYFLSFECVSLLIEKYQFDLHVKNNKGYTSFDYANKRMKRWIKNHLGRISKVDSLPHKDPKDIKLKRLSSPPFHNTKNIKMTKRKPRKALSVELDNQYKSTTKGDSTGVKKSEPSYIHPTAKTDSKANTEGVIHHITASDTRVENRHSIIDEKNDNLLALSRPRASSLPLDSDRSETLDLSLDTIDTPKAATLPPLYHHEQEAKESPSNKMKINAQEFYFLKHGPPKLTAKLKHRHSMPSNVDP